MDESAIADNVRQNIPQPAEFTPAAPATPSLPGAAIQSPTELDEMSQYKLHEYFGERYRDTDEISRQQVQYIFDSLAKQIGTTDYLEVLTKIRNLEQIMGSSHGDNRLYKLYQWLKLDNIRRRAEQEMNIMGGVYGQ